MCSKERSKGGFASEGVKEANEKNTTGEKECFEGEREEESRGRNVKDQEKRK